MILNKRFSNSNDLTLDDNKIEVVKGAMGFGTFKSIDFKKNWYVKVPVVPCSLML